MRFSMIVAASMTFAGCVPVENVLEQQASNSACARSETSWGRTTLEMPPENLGGDLVGMYTLTEGRGLRNTVGIRCLIAGAGRSRGSRWARMVATYANGSSG